MKKGEIYIYVCMSITFFSFFFEDNFLLRNIFHALKEFSAALDQLQS